MKTYICYWELLLGNGCSVAAIIKGESVILALLENGIKLRSSNKNTLW
jgi:hypothetical protein